MTRGAAARRVVRGCGEQPRAGAGTMREANRHRPGRGRRHAGTGTRRRPVFGPPGRRGRPGHISRAPRQEPGRNRVGTSHAGGRAGSCRLAGMPSGFGGIVRKTVPARRIPRILRVGIRPLRLPRPGRQLPGEIPATGVRRAQFPGAAECGENSGARRAGNSPVIRQRADEPAVHRSADAVPASGGGRGPARGHGHLVPSRGERGCHPGVRAHRTSPDPAGSRPEPGFSPHEAESAPDAVRPGSARPTGSSAPRTIPPSKSETDSLHSIRSIAPPGTPEHFSAPAPAAAPDAAPVRIGPAVHRRARRRPRGNTGNRMSGSETY